MTPGPAGRAGAGAVVPAVHTCCEDCAPATAAHPDERWLRNARYARWLAWASLAWMAAEGIVGLAAGFAAGSIALVGLGAGQRHRGTGQHDRRLAVHRVADAVRNRRTASARSCRGQPLTAGPLHRDRGHPRPGGASP